MPVHAVMFDACTPRCAAVVARGTSMPGLSCLLIACAGGAGGPARRAACRASGSGRRCGWGHGASAPCRGAMAAQPCLKNTGHVPHPGLAAPHARERCCRPNQGSEIASISGDSIKHHRHQCHNNQRQNHPQRISPHCQCRPQCMRLATRASASVTSSTSNTTSARGPQCGPHPQCEPLWRYSNNTMASVRGITPQQRQSTRGLTISA